MLFLWSWKETWCSIFLKCIYVLIATISFFFLDQYKSCHLECTHPISVNLLLQLFFGFSFIHKAYVLKVGKVFFKHLDEYHVFVVLISYWKDFFGWK